MDSTQDPPSPLVDICGYLENPPSPPRHPHGLWMFPSVDLLLYFVKCKNKVSNSDLAGKLFVLLSKSIHQDNF